MKWKIKQNTDDRNANTKPSFPFRGCEDRGANVN